MKLNGNLTKREKDIVAGMGLGKTNKEMADDLKISIKTVEKHADAVLPPGA